MKKTLRKRKKGRGSMPGKMFDCTGILLCEIFVLSNNSQAIASELGNISGEIFLHIESFSPEFEDNEAYVNTHLGLKYETPEWNGVSMATAFRNGAKIWEKNEDDAKPATGALLTEAYLQYETDDVLPRIGRQEIDQEWIEDSHEAVTLSFSPLSMLEIFSGYTRRFAVADEDTISSDFEDIGKHGTYFADFLIANEDQIWGVTPYFLHTPDLYTGYGVKLSFSFGDQRGFVVHYASSDVKEPSNENGSFFHSILEWTVAGINVDVGFIQTGDEGVGFLDLLGDRANPLEEGGLVYEADATTYYVSLERTFNDLEIVLILGNTDTGESGESEIDLLVNYDLEELWYGTSLDFVFSSINGKEDEQDRTIFTLNIRYEFGDN